MARRSLQSLGNWRALQILSRGTFEYDFAPISMCGLHGQRSLLSGETRLLYSTFTSSTKWDANSELRPEDCFLRGLRVFKCTKCGFPLRRALNHLFKLALSSQETLHTLQLPILVFRGIFGLSCPLWNMKLPNLKHLIVVG